jgi:hypothetical protein
MPGLPALQSCLIDVSRSLWRGVHNPIHNLIGCQHGQLGCQRRITGAKVMNYQAPVASKDSNINNFSRL